ncbi:hypothetical protein AUJ68_05450 [Candidatus Woesearchaeota archaeon CG1_02_57_44]|nr:MAG: hypothetical protein AUJ68_05450 [Candidatus Woesearchaeota archaeon CG1_02_57_44]
MISWRHFLAPGAPILLPGYSLAGEINDPAIHGPSHGYDVDMVAHWHAPAQMTSPNLQRGELFLYALRER